MKLIIATILLFILVANPVSPQSAGLAPPGLGGGGGGTERVESESRAPSFQQPSPDGLSAVRDLSQSPWFALTSGLASILGLLLALYATQVRTIPFSLYRSLMWRKVLLIASGVGCTVFSGIKFYIQEEAPAIDALGVIHASIVGVYRVSAIDQEAHGTSAWAILFALGAILFFMGMNYDPAARAREILVREHQTLQRAQESQLSNVLGGRRVDSLPPVERHMFNDALEYYRYVQWRFADVVLGAPPSTFPLFVHNPSRLTNEYMASVSREDSNDL